MNDTPNTIRLLIADDNAATRAATIALLEASVRRATVFEAANGEEAIRLAETLQPDVVLMDVQMPLMDGYEATRRIGALAPGLPVIGQTAHAMAEERAKCIEAGMVDHVAKPFEADQVVDVILRSMKRGARNPAHETGIRREPHE